MLRVPCPDAERIGALVRCRVIMVDVQLPAITLFFHMNLPSNA